jgi:hypothetical protein
MQHATLKIRIGLSPCKLLSTRWYIIRPLADSMAVSPLPGLYYFFAMWTLDSSCSFHCTYGFCVHMLTDNFAGSNHTIKGSHFTASVPVG